MAQALSDAVNFTFVEKTFNTPDGSIFNLVSKDPYRIAIGFFYNGNATAINITTNPSGSVVSGFRLSTQGPTVFDLFTWGALVKSDWYSVAAASYQITVFTASVIHGG